MVHIWQNGHRRLTLARRAIRSYFEALRTCPGCGRSVSLLADFCPTCGTAGSVMIPVSPVTLFTSLGSLALVVLLRWT